MFQNNSLNVSYTRDKPYIHDTTGCTTRCTTRCTTSCTTSCTTGCTTGKHVGKIKAASGDAGPAGLPTGVYIVGGLDAPINTSEGSGSPVSTKYSRYQLNRERDFYIVT